MTDDIEDEIIHETLETDCDEPVVQIAEVVSDLEDVPEDELKPTYTHLDHVVDYIFSNPPEPAAQVQITFTYEGYRVTVEQDGHAQFVKIA